MFIIFFDSAYPGYPIVLLLGSRSKLLHLGHFNSLYLKIPMDISLKGATSIVICTRFWKWKQGKYGMKSVCGYMLNDCVMEPYTLGGLNWSCMTYLKSVISIIFKHPVLHQHSDFNADMFMYIIENHTHVIGKSQTMFIVDSAATVFHNTPS